MFGIDDAATAVSGLLGKVIDKIFPDPNDAAKAKAALAAAEFEPDLQQIKVNMQEAASTSVFVAGWRPFIGWVCGGAFAYKFIVQPFMLFFVTLFGWNVPLATLPVLDWQELGGVLFGMLGLGYLRTREKIKGAA